MKAPAPLVRLKLRARLKGLPRIEQRPQAYPRPPRGSDSAGQSRGGLGSPVLSMGRHMGARFPTQVGMRVEHPKHGAGVVAERMADGRTRVAYDNGEEHRYKPSSMHKLVRGDSPDDPASMTMAAFSKIAGAGATAGGAKCAPPCLTTAPDLPSEGSGRSRGSLPQLLGILPEAPKFGSSPQLPPEISPR